MKLVTYRSGDSSKAKSGLLIEGRIYPLEAAGYRDALAFVATGKAAQQKAAESVRGAASTPVQDVQLLAPLLNPPRIFCVGLNYRDHAAESKMAVQAVPTIFMKLASAIVGPGADIVLPGNSTQPDFEAELAVVIGRTALRIDAAQAPAHIAGYLTLNDVSASDMVRADKAFVVMSSNRGFCPCGPWIATPDEVAEPGALAVTLRLDGTLRQGGNTADLVFGIAELIAYASTQMPLDPGDIIATGTPAGVAASHQPAAWLRPGSAMVAEVQGLGALRNPITTDDS